MAACWEIASHWAYYIFSKYKYLIVNLVFFHLCIWSGNFFLIAPFPDPGFKLDKKFREKFCLPKKIWKKFGLKFSGLPIHYILYTCIFTSLSAH